jgi:hypothetical protein
LKNLYDKSDVTNYIQKTQTDFDKVQKRLFARMEKVTNHPIYRNDFTCFITSFPRFPYDYEKGYIWISNKRTFDGQVSIFIHELLHFQYFAYFGEKVWDELGPNKHGELKEAMTVILNEEFRDFTSEKEEGYEIHQELRKKLLLIWKKTKNMDLFIEKAIKLMKV